MTTDGPPALGDLAEEEERRSELRAAADHVLAGAWSTDAAIALLDEPEGAWAADLWATVVDLGWSQVLTADGGGTIADLCVLTEAIGAAAAPLPLAVAGVAACADPSPDGLTVVAHGPAASCETANGALVASGTWPLVEHGQVATAFVVPVTGADGRRGLAAVDVDQPGVEIGPARPLDRSPAAEVTLRGAEVRPLEVEAGALELRLDLARAAELVGVAAGANAAAVEYAKERVTFGRPIGSYQAIKHRLVDQRVAIEVARALVGRAADAVERGTDDAAAHTALAAFWAADTLRQVPEGAVQVFGGIGYTWEHPAHLYLRRAAVLTALLGPTARHRPVVTAWLAGRQEPAGSPR